MDIVISVIALIVSIVSLIRTMKIDKISIAQQQESANLAKLQRAIIEREEAENNSVTVSAIWYIASKNNHRIEVINTGHKRAKSIDFSFIESNRDLPIISGEIEEKFPIACLDPGEKRSFRIAPDQSTGMTWKARLSWLDEAGKQYEKECNIGE